MNCKDYQDKILELLDNGIDPLSDKSVSSHLSECTDCEAEYQRLSRLFNLLEDDKGLEVEGSHLDNLVVDVNRAIDREKKIIHFNPQYIISFITAAAAAIMIAFIGTSNFSGSGLLSNNITWDNILSISHYGFPVEQIIESALPDSTLRDAFYSEIGDKGLNEMENYLIKTSDYNNLINTLDESELEYLNSKIQAEMKNIS